MGISCGRDSTVSLDKLWRTGEYELSGFFMYYVPRLSFQESYLRYLEKRYSIEILRLPHWELSQLFQKSALRNYTHQTVPGLTIKDIEAYVRHQTGCDYIAYGHRIADSLWRRGWLNKYRKTGGVDEENKIIYPVLEMNKQQIIAYMRAHRIPEAPEYAFARRSFGITNDGRIYAYIKQHYPDDYRKILEVFPYVEAITKRYEFGKAPKFCNRDRLPAGDKGGAVQPAQD